MMFLPFAVLVVRAVGWFVVSGVGCFVCIRSWLSVLYALLEILYLLLVVLVVWRNDSSSLLKASLMPNG